MNNKCNVIKDLCSTTQKQLWLPTNVSVNKLVLKKLIEFLYTVLEGTTVFIGRQ